MMTMPEGRISRMPAVEAREAAAAAGLPGFMAELSVFQIALKNPPVAKALNDQLHTLLERGRLDARLRELVIMRIGWATGSVYEWTQHWRVARRIGMAEDDILGVRDWTRYGGYGPVERAVLAATDETLADGVITPATWDELRRLLDDDAVLFELVVAIGNWRLFSSLLRSLEVPLEDGVAAWPPDGHAPSLEREAPR
jgi:alkylhydroperoxidase family enzyme